MFWRIVMFLLLLVFAAVALLKWPVVNPASGGGAWPPSVVELQAVETVSWPRELTSTGTVEALDFTIMTPDVPGKISRLNFRSGRPVKKGQVLFELETTVERARIGALQADVNLAEKELARAKNLYSRKAIAKADFDRASSRAEQTLAALQSQQAMVDQKTYRAPFDGITGISTTDIGEYFNPGEPVVTVSAIDTVLIGFFIPEQQVSELAEGQNFTLTTSAWPGQTFSGKIQAVEPRIDPQTRNVALIGAVENADHKLRPGMFVDIRLALGGAEQYTVVPRTAVSFNPFGNVVYVAEPRENKIPQTESELAFRLDWPPLYRETVVTGEIVVKDLAANQRFVQTGETRGNMIAITQGLNVGERLVVTGQQKLRNGASITTAALQAAAAAANQSSEEKPSAPAAQPVEK